MLVYKSIKGIEQNYLGPVPFVVDSSGLPLPPWLGTGLFIDFVLDIYYRFKNKNLPNKK